jgi:two-component system, cell cycle sensor histidine kinase and response regulator CckA
VESSPLSVLVVEDDATVRSVVGQMLDAPGRRILVAANAAEAMSLASSTDLDLLVTDVVLPHISGHRIAKLVRAFHPGLPVLYISGWYDHPQFPELEGETILHKPFSCDELESAIAAALR